LNLRGKIAGNTSDVLDTIEFQAIAGNLSSTLALQCVVGFSACHWWGSVFQEISGIFSITLFKF
jgi:hypothetical protein